MNFKTIKVLKNYGGTRVTLGKDLENDVLVVEKRLITNEKNIKILFENEKKFLTKLQHFNIIKFFGESGDTLSFFIEYAPFDNLISFFKKNNKNNSKRIFVRQVLDTLIFLHKLGIVHNDIKPSNILVVDYNRCKLEDFAFAGYIGEPAFPEMSFVYGVGTYGYVKDLNVKTHSTNNDLFGFGKLLYEILTDEYKTTNIDFHKVDAKYRNVIKKSLNIEYSSANEIYNDLSNLTDNFSFL